MATVRAHAVRGATALRPHDHAVQASALRTVAFRKYGFGRFLCADGRVLVGGYAEEAFPEAHDVSLFLMKPLTSPVYVLFRQRNLLREGQ